MPVGGRPQRQGGRALCYAQRRFRLEDHRRGPVDGLGDARKCCLEQIKNLSPALQAGQDDTNSERIQLVHDNFVRVVKLVPGGTRCGHARERTSDEESCASMTAESTLVREPPDRCEPALGVVDRVGELGATSMAPTIRQLPTQRRKAGVADVKDPPPDGVADLGDHQRDQAFPVDGGVFAGHRGSSREWRGSVRPCSCDGRRAAT